MLFQRPVEFEEWEKFIGLYEKALAQNLKKDREAAFDEVLACGNELLDICDRDRFGIRFYTMAVYAMCGDLKSAEAYQKALTERMNGGPDLRESAVKQEKYDIQACEEMGMTWAGGWRENTRHLEYLEKLEADPYAFIEEGDRRMLYHLAMCYWKKGEKLLARKCLEQLPELGKFLSLTEEEIQEIRTAKEAQRAGYRYGTYEELIDTIPIPKKERQPFDKWILYA